HRPTARQSAGEPTYRGLGISYARRLGDAVDPAPLLFGRETAEGWRPQGADRLIRGDGNLTVIGCGRRFAAQRDSLIADDVGTHGWGILIDPAGGAGHPTHALFSDPNHPLPDKLLALLSHTPAWNCLNPAPLAA